MCYKPFGDDNPLQTPRSASEVALRDEQKRDPHAGSNHQNGNLCRFRRADIGEMHYVTMWMFTPEISNQEAGKKKVETLSPVLRWTERRGILLGCLGPRESPVRTPGGLKWSNNGYVSNWGSPKPLDSHGFPVIFIEVQCWIIIQQKYVSLVSLCNNNYDIYY